MNKSIRKLMSLVLAVVLCLGMMPAVLLPVSAESAEPEEGVIYSQDFEAPLKESDPLYGVVEVSGGTAKASTFNNSITIPPEYRTASNNYELSFDVKQASEGAFFFIHFAGLNGNTGENIYMACEGNGAYWSMADFNGHMIYNNSGNLHGGLNANPVDITDNFAHVRIVKFGGYMELWVNGTRLCVSHLSNFGNNNYHTRAEIAEGTITGSVFLSSFTTKVAVYALIRIFAGTDFLMAAGCFMALYGALYAIMENDMRRLLGYHIISQVGFMVAGVGVGTAMALNGAAAHAFSHILYKSLLFMCAGAIIYATGIRKINQLSGMAKRMPFVALCFFVAAFSISGVPLFNGFISKTITIAAAAEAGYDWVYTLLELASVGTFLSITLKMGYFIFLRNEEKDIVMKHKLPKNMYVAMGLGACLCFLYGVYPDLLYRFLPFGTVTYEPFTAAHLLSYVEILVVTMVPFMMFLPRMEPHTALSLDTDWFYRKPFAAIVNFVSGLMCALCKGLGDAWGIANDKFMDLTSNPMDFLDARPFRKRTHYNPENYRTSIADPMMIILTVLVSCAAYFITSLRF